jgi:SepF-like predicted cell division protein (DUF552 family)
MALLKDIFGRRKSDEEDHMELPVEEVPAEKVSVRIEHLTGLADVERIIKYVREGSILFLKTRDLQKRDLGQFQTAVQKLKRVCTNMGFDLAGTEEGYLVVTPRFAQIARE